MIQRQKLKLIILNKLLKMFKNKNLSHNFINKSENNKQKIKKTRLAKQNQMILNKIRSNKKIRRS